MNSEWKKFFKGFYYAGNGIKAGFEERNMKVHGVVTVGVILAGIVWRASALEWVAVLVVAGMVWMAELFNSSVEEMADLLRETHKYEYKTTKKLRDMSAGAVLVAAIVAAITGLLIFVPKIFA